jgi:Arc/MetJ-type ribon-helix-helix transcriptional regulator
MKISYDNIIHFKMPTLSIPVTQKMSEGINDLVEQGIASNKAELVRKAIDKYLEDQAVEEIMRALKEPRLEGDLDELAKKIY